MFSRPTNEICSACGKERTVSKCEKHKPLDHGGCNYCHLMKHHIVKDVDKAKG